MNEPDSASPRVLATDFVGREPELALLRGAWASALAGRPQFVALVGEARLGKTRVVQEFYHWLNREHDASGYWPDSLPRTDDSLAVNPRFEPESAPAGVTPPWLWWGVRWLRPGQTNPGEFPRSAVVAAADSLRPHVEIARRWVERQRVEREAWIGVGKSAASLATGGLAGTGIEVLERLQDWWRVRQERRVDDASVVAIAERQSQGELQELEEFLIALCGTPRIVPDALPLVLVLDDTHWADATSLRFLHRLLGALTALDRPPPPVRLLVIATTWEREWNEQTATARASDGALRATAEPPTFPALVEMLRNRLDGREPAFDVHEQRLARLTDSLEPLVAQELPGLTPAQRALVVDRAGGSPGLLRQLLLKLRGRSRHLFERNEPTRALSARGEQALREMTVNYHELVEERLQELSNAEAMALRTASWLGLSYSRELVRDLLAPAAGAESLGLTSQEIDTALTRADYPLALVQPTTARVDEFRLPVYREILRRQYDETEELQTHVEARATDCARHWAERERDPEESFEERWSVLGFVAQRLADGLQQQDDADDRRAFLKVLAEMLREVLPYDVKEFARPALRTWFGHWRRWSAEATLDLGDERLDAVLSTAAKLGLNDEGSALAELCVAQLSVESGATQLASQPALARSLRFRRHALDFAIALTRTNEADGHAAALLADARALVAEYGATSAHLHELRVALARLGQLAQQSRRWHDALAVYREGVELGERIVELEPQDTRWRAELAATRMRLAVALQRTDQVDAAITLTRTTLADYERLFATDSANVRWRLEALAQRVRLGDLLLSASDPEGALSELEPAAAENEALMREFVEDPQGLWLLAWTRHRVCEALLALGRHAQAWPVAVAVVRVRERLLAEATGTDAEPERRHELAEAQTRLGGIELRAGQVESACERFEASRANTEAAAGGERGFVVLNRELMNHIGLVGCRRRLGDATAMETEARGGLMVLEEIETLQPAYPLDVQRAFLQEAITMAARAGQPVH